MDNTDFINTIKRIALNAVDTTKPVNIVYGKVVSTNPLKIKIEQKITVSSKQLIIPSKFKVEKKEVNIKFTYEEQEIQATGEFTIDNSFKNNDTVIMLRLQGGQKYLVIDKEDVRDT